MTILGEAIPTLLLYYLGILIPIDKEKMLRMQLVKIRLDVYARATSVAHGHQSNPKWHRQQSTALCP